MPLPEDISLEGIPLVDTRPGSPVYDLLASDLESGSDDDMARTLWSDFRAQLIPKLESLGDCTDSNQLRRELHAIRGTSAQFGLFLLEVFLFFWEMKVSDPLSELQRFIPAAVAIAEPSIRAIEKSMPHLRGDSLS